MVRRGGGESEKSWLVAVRIVLVGGGWRRRRVRVRRSSLCWWLFTALPTNESQVAATRNRRTPPSACPASANALALQRPGVPLTRETALKTFKLCKEGLAYFSSYREECFSTA